MIHAIHPDLLERFGVALIGAGGSGSQMLTCLARLHHAITALGHPGFDVTVYDPDTVSEANVGRQMFAPADIGLHKARVLVHRVNQFFGLGWEAQATTYRPGRGQTRLTISCVDSRKSRREIHKQVSLSWSSVYLLDLGNRAADGQAILGQYIGKNATAFAAPDHVNLPSPYELLPELIAAGPEDDAPSCSLAEALERQELFVNDDVTRAASLILWNLLRHGRLTWHGAFVNSHTGRRTALAVDPDAWARMRPAPNHPQRSTHPRRTTA